MVIDLSEMAEDLSPIEMAAAIRGQTAYRVHVRDGLRLEVLGIIAPDACAALVKGLRKALPDFDSYKPASLSVRVEPVRRS